MRWCRIRLVLLGLLLCVVHVVSGTCGQTFTDPESSALLADLVIEGKVRKTSKPDAQGVFSISVSLRKNILKGSDMIDRLQTKKLELGWFQDGQADTDQCIGSVDKGRTYFFYLRNSTESNGLQSRKSSSGLDYEIMAMPTKKSKKYARKLRKILCKGCAKSPSIKRLQGPKNVSEGSKVTLKCTAKAKPNPVFSWYKDGVLVTPRRGLRIKYGKRQSKLQIKRASVKDAGQFECVAVNAVGEDRQSLKIKVQGKGEGQHRPCETQTFCLNGGTCMHTPSIGITFCQCLTGYIGNRCEKEEADTSLYPGVGQANLLYERTLIIVGIVIAVLVFIIICIASYFLAKRRRQKFEERRKRREDKRGTNRAETVARGKTPSESANRHGNVDPTSKQLGHIVLQDSASSHRSPPGHADPQQHQPQHQSVVPHRQEQQQQQPLLKAEVESRRRLAASSIYENSEETHNASQLNQYVDCEQNGIIAPEQGESIEMKPLGDTADAQHRGVGDSHHGEPYANVNDGNTYLNMPSPSTPSSSASSESASLTRPPPSYHHLNESNGQPSEFPVISLQPQPPPSSSSSPSTPGLEPHLCHEDAFPMLNAKTSTEPLLSMDNKFPPSHLPLESKSDKDFSRYVTATSKQHTPRSTPRAHEASGYQSDPSEHFPLLKTKSKVSHSNTFPKTKVNGKTANTCSESDDDDDDDDDECDDEDEEVPYQRHSDLHISEEDLGLSKENLINSSFSSVVAPSRQGSREDPVLALVQNLNSTRPEMRKYLSEEGPAYSHILANKTQNFLQDNARSHSLDEPVPSLSRAAPVKAHGMNSTLAGSPDVETYDNVPAHAGHLLNHNYAHEPNPNAYDPNEDLAPWDGEMDRANSLTSLTEEDKDRLNRLRDVLPDQQPIPI